MCFVYFLLVIVRFVVSRPTSAVDCLERLISEMTYCVSGETLNTLLTQSVLPFNG